MRRVLALSTFVLLLARGGHASQLAFTVDPEEVARRSFGLLNLPFREYAQVYLDGDLAGDTLRLRARRGIALPPGRYRVDVIAHPSTGCEPFVGAAEIVAGKSTTTLMRADGTLASPGDLFLHGCFTTIHVVAPAFCDADVLVDGVRVGRTSEDIRVRSGRRVVEVEALEKGENPRRWRWTSEIDIRPSDGPQEIWAPITLAN